MVEAGQDSPRSTPDPTGPLLEEFLALWDSGKRPKIETFLDRVAPSYVPALFAKLLPAEILFRCGRREQLDRREYLERFPSFLGLIREAFGRLPTGAEGFEPPTQTADRTKAMPSRIGRYPVHRVLGVGGYGTVYLARDEALNRWVAIKVPRMERLSSQQALESFLREARTLASLKHPGIVAVYDVVQEENLCYIVSEHIEGESLQDWSRRRRLSFHEIAQLVAQVADALHMAHCQGVIHRDIKPSNILLDAEGLPHVVDFGVAIRMDDLAELRGSRVGTRRYMSPEQIRGEGHRVDGRTDIYGLGVMLYELLCGCPPFDEDSEEELYEQVLHADARPPRAIDDSIPPALERICLKAISKRLTDRYATAKEMGVELRSAAQATPVTEAREVSRFANRSLPAVARVIPKGLRSFEAVDAEFFLELLPGPRDASGLPDSIRFWKTRIESTLPSESFSVGLIYGPSGCGKSSLVKAGIIPHLAPHVVPIYLEVAEDTESRLRSALVKRFPILEGCSDLVEVFRRIRRGGVLPAGRKLCIILDQIEQWLHLRSVAEPDGESPLVDAMRQADGEHLQCLLMVRDDFWVSIARVFQELEIPLLEGKNSRLVDLFDLRHARQVLRLFGQAYESLPPDPAKLLPEQKTFLDHAVRGLSEQGKVISVRLALFADMMKGRPWTPRSLSEVGGMDGIGVAFLEETFFSRTAHPEHRLHHKAARAVLAYLLPPGATEIRSRVSSRAELLQASGYADRPAEFERLLQMLDGELRIITLSETGMSVDPATAEPADERRAEGSGPYYQLTHDYLVPSLREWLNRKRRETRQGRAKMLLEERADEWGRTHQDRFLPSPYECLRILLFTRKTSRNQLQQDMLKRAMRNWAMRLATVVCVAFAAALVLVSLLSPTARSPLEIFEDSGRDVIERLGALPDLALDDEAVFARVLYVQEKDDDAGLASELMNRIANHLQAVGEVGDQRRKRFVTSLQALMYQSSKPVEIRAAALNTLAAIAPTVDLVKAAGQLVRSDPPPELSRSLCELMKRLADREAATTSEPGSPRAALVELSGEWIREPSHMYRVPMFEIFAQLASPALVIEQMKNAPQAASDQPLAAAMRDYVARLDLASQPELIRSDTLRRLLDAIGDSSNQPLAAACRQQLDKYPADILCGWFMDIRAGEDARSPAQTTVRAYASACSGCGNPARIQELAAHVRRALAEAAQPMQDYDIRVSYRLEFLICAIGHLQIPGAAPDGEVMQTLNAILANRGRLEDPAVLELVVESLAQIAKTAKGSVDLRLVRETFADRATPTSVRISAADALGRLHDEEAVAALLKTASTIEPDDGDMFVRVTAITSLGRIGAQVKEGRGNLAPIDAVLRPLADPKQKQPNRASKERDSAILAFAEIAEAKDAALLFAWLNDIRLRLTASKAISIIVQKNSAQSVEIIRAYLAWRLSESGSAGMQQLPDVDNPIVGIAQYGIDLPLETQRKAQEAVPAALAQLSQAHPDKKTRELAGKWLDLLRLRSVQVPPTSPAHRRPNP